LQDWRQRGRRSGDPEDDVLGTFVDFLRSADIAAFGRLLTWLCALKPALRSGPSAGVAADRVGVADDLLWRSSLNRRSSACAAWRATPLSIWLRSIRAGPSTIANPLRYKSWRRIYLRRDRAKLVALPLGSLLVVGLRAALATAEMRALRIELQDNGRLRGNRPSFPSRRVWVRPTTSRIAFWSATASI